MGLRSVETEEGYAWKTAGLRGGPTNSTSNDPQNNPREAVISHDSRETESRDAIRRLSEVKLRELRSEIQESAKNPFGEKAYPITSDWIPVTDVTAIIDRFEKEWRREFETVLSKAKTHGPEQLKELVQRIITDLLA